MRHPASDWDDFEESIFSRMSQLASEVGAINLSQGFPDFEGPDVVVEAARLALTGQRNQYAPSAGLPGLRAAIAARRQAAERGSFDADQEVTVFSGATEAVFCAVMASASAGDEILAFEPFYDGYPAAAFATGARLVGVPLTPGEWTIDFEALEAACTSRTTALIANFPHNPTGHVPDRDAMQRLADFCLRRGLRVITDEVYEELTFERPFFSLAQIDALRPQLIVASSLAKTFSFTGWKVGFAFAPPEITRRLRKIHQFTVFCSATPLQYGAIAALELDADYYTELRRQYQALRDQLTAGLRNAGFTVRPADGTYFALAGYGELSEQDDRSFCDYLAREIGVAAIPISPFFCDPARAAALRYVRFAFCKAPEALDAACERLQKLS